MLITVIVTRHTRKNVTKCSVLARHHTFQRERLGSSWGR